ncbi:MAG: hypothetical protein OHK0038_12340 [Flammeovirgaceae bacterium]
MEYHQDRFEDYSLMIYKENKLIAILPANIRENTLYSHEGLTFGGFLFTNKMTSLLMLDVVEKLFEYLRKNNIKRFIYKSIPYIFHQNPSQEDLFALTKSRAKLYKRELSTAIDLENYKLQKRRKKYLKKIKNEDFSTKISESYSAFWNILNEQLPKRHNTKPVHSLSEIEYLANLFPENILHIICTKSLAIQAGAVIYLTPTVAHLQYMVANEEGLKNRALNFLMDTILQKFKDKRFLSFGISTENNGQILNEGLVTFKESFGGRTIVHDVYEYKID